VTKGKIALCVVAGLLAAYVAAAPYITVHQMKSAAQRRDGEALAEHIEFPSVRQSLKDQLNASFLKQMANDKKMADNPFAALGAAFAGVMIDRIVDAYVTPAGLAQLMAGEKPQIESTPHGEAPDDTRRDLLVNASMSYESLDKFVVRIANADGQEGRLVLRRRGFGWKLTDIIAPLD
jgi:hypothetical protein